MRRILLAKIAILLAAQPAAAGSITIEAGWSVPKGSFAEPARVAFAEKGAEPSFTFGLKYNKPLVFFELVSELSYVQFGEEYLGPSGASEPQDYVHTFIPATIGLRGNIFGALPVHPYLGASVGLYGYMARGEVLIENPPGTGEYAEENFTAVIRPGFNFAAGVIMDVPFSFDLAAEVKYHLMIFQGVGDDITDREYPYTIDADSRTFVTLTVGLVF